MSLHHFYTDYTPSSKEATLRNVVARATWTTQPWIEVPVKDSELPRMWQEEGKQFPYVIDLFDIACNGKDPDSVMVYTNSDICVVSDCAMIVVEAIQETDAFYSYRVDFNHDFQDPIDDAIVRNTRPYAGSDLYGFRAGWWMKWRKEFPDMIIAMELWDSVIRRLIQITNPNKRVDIPNTHYHRRHGSYWEDPKNRYRLKGQMHNLRIGGQWLLGHGVNPSVHGVPRHIYNKR